MTHPPKYSTEEKLIKYCELKGFFVREIETHHIGNDVFTHMQVHIQDNSRFAPLSFRPETGQFRKLVWIALAMGCYVLPVIDAEVTSDGEDKATYVYFVSRDYLERISARIRAFKAHLSTNYWFVQGHEHTLEVRDDLVEMNRSVNVVKEFGEETLNKGHSKVVVLFNLDIVQRFDGLEREIRNIDAKMVQYPEFDQESFQDFLEK